MTRPKHIFLNIVGTRESYAAQHNAAIKTPFECEISIVQVFEALQTLAQRHLARYGEPIGEDLVLGAHWADMACALRGLLNGDCGRLDCGTVDGAILALAREHGVEIES